MGVWPRSRGKGARGRTKPAPKHRRVTTVKEPGDDHVYERIREKPTVTLAPVPWMDRPMPGEGMK